MELSATLPTLRQSDAEWINSNFRNKWQNKGLCYYVIMERKAEWQVLRWYYKSRKRRFECMQIWLNETSEVVVAKRRFMRYDGWIESDPMIPKHIRKNACYTYLGDVRYCPASECKVRSLLPIFKRNGIKTSIHGFSSPYALLMSLLRKPRLETLWKLRQFHLVNYFYWGNTLSDEVWQAIRVALRHGYSFTSYDQVSDWNDMIRMMHRCGADIHNPTLICPADLKAAHDHWMRINHRLQDIRHDEYMKRNVADYEPFFRATREQFFDMLITDGEIVIKAIPTAQAIVDEGKAMHHCVGGYYNRTASLILSATINGKRIETIEVNLNNYTLVQSRGLQNCSTKYHDRIVEMMEANLELIRVLDINHKGIERKTLNELRKAS
jgi:hypothetical protein